MYTEAEIIAAVTRHVNSMTVQQLINYVLDDFVSFYCDHADPEDLEIFIGDEENGN